MDRIIRKTFAFIIGNIIFIGIPIIAFGADKLNIYFSDIGRFIYSIGMFVFTLISVIFVPNQGRGTANGEKTISSQKIIKTLLQILPLLIITVAPYSDGRDILTFKEMTYIKYLSLILIFAGNSLMNIAAITLGKQFSVELTIKKDHKLITSGIYSLIRHPRYTGIIMFFTGISLLFRSFLAIAIIFLLIGVILWRITKEEKLMKAEFKKEWDKYKDGTWKLLPYIY